MNTKLYRLSALPLSLLAVGVLLAAGCTEASPPDEEQIVARAPDVTPLGTGRFKVNGDASGSTESDSWGQESCEPDDAGGWECSWDDGETLCTYGVDAAGVLTHQECSGPWGEYDCDNTGTELVCVWTSERGSCTDTYSLDYELIASDCSPDMYYPEEDCVTQDDGSTRCSWDDGYTTCEMVYGADGSFVSQSCTDGYWSYDCLASDELIVCDLLVEGEYLCTDSYDPMGNLVEDGCGQYVEREDPDEPSYEECLEQEDGSWLCLYDDGYTTCEMVYDADGYFVSQVCTDGYYSYNCQAADELITCELLIEGEWVCGDTYDAMGNPVEMGCDGYIEYPEDPDDPAIEECTEQADGSLLCTYDDGYWACSYSYDAAGMLVSSDCDSSDGTMSYDCATDPDDGLLHCEMQQGEEVCEEVYDQRGGLVSTTCYDATGTEDGVR